MMHKRTIAILAGACALLVPAANANAEQDAVETEVASMVELEVAGPNGALKGSYLGPPAPSAAVLIIPGSGPTDRNGNNPMGMVPGTYRLLAEALAEKGIASLRIDKRGMFGSTAAVPDANAVTLADYAGDALQWADRLREVSGQRCVWLAGHSEGGLVALVAAQGNPDRLCGLILLAAPGRPLGTLLREQIGANPANGLLAAEADSIIARLEQGETVAADRISPILLTLFAPQVQGFLIDTMARDPAALAAATRLPMMIVQGGEDLQVRPADAHSLAAARPDARLVLIDGLSHTLKQVPGEGIAANQATYVDPSLPVDPQVVAAIAGFVTGPESAALISKEAM